MTVHWSLITAFLRLSRPVFLLGGFALYALGAFVARHNEFDLDNATYWWGQLVITAHCLVVH